MIIGTHALMFSPDAEGVRDLLRDAFELRSVDAGGGWPVFALPPAELAVHPGAGEPRVELWLMCDDIHATLAELAARGVTATQPVAEQSWGLATALALPGGGELGLYEPRHPSPLLPPP
jgi:hypothetical protein